MKKIIFDFNRDCACVKDSELKQIISRTIPEVRKVKGIVGTGYGTDYASVNLPSDKKSLQKVKEIIGLKVELDIKILVVVGIGGSNLGTIALHKALNGTLYNEKNPETKIYFADTVDSDYLSDIIYLVEEKLKNNENILINVVTKSGTTTETIANFEIFLELLKKYKPDDYNDYIVVTTDRGSKLWQFAEQNEITYLEVPKNVGGRYSVFSSVGLFPLGFLGLDLESLLKGAQSAIVDCTDDTFENNPAGTSASIMYYHYKRGLNIHDTFIFSKNFYSVGGWYRQLVGESLGKKFDRSGNLVEVGITPTASLGTTDLHSVAQLYLGGPRDKFTTFVTAKPKTKVILPKIDSFEKLVESIQGRAISSIMDAVVKGVQAAYKEDERPFVSVHLPRISEFFVGQFLQWKMLEIIYLGYLFEVNPFDQPQVELYKKETKKALAR